jgi:ATP/maltotriose-dependent transcriptional regulator MalT
VVDEMLRAVEGGSTRLLQVAGEPGIGKTRLLAEVCTRAEAHGFVVLAGRAAELERDLPFGVVADVLDGHLASLDSSDLESLHPELVPELAGLVPSVRAAGSPPRYLRHERYRAYRAVRTLLDLLAERRPLVVVFDDLHWADRASVELLSYVMRHPPRARVALATAFRPGQVSAELASILRAATLRGEAHRLDLVPLTYEEALELMGNDPTRDAAHELYRESGGNPFFLQELLRARGRPFPSGTWAETFEGVPLAVRHALAEELEVLSPAARSLLEHAAVVGDPFEIDLTGTLADLGDAGAWGPLDELLALDLVRTTPQPRRFSFRHPIVRRAVYESTSTGWRMGAHARAGAALGSRGAPASARAHHVERSAAVGDEHAVTLLTEAAHAAAEAAPAIAARWYQAALRLLPEGPRGVERRSGLLAPLAGAFAAVGELEGSRETLLEALGLPAASPEARIRLVTSCAAVEHLLGYHSDARARLLAALGELPHDSPHVATVKNELAVDAMYANQFEQACVWARQAHDTASSQCAGGPHLAISAALVAYAEAWMGRTGCAEPYLAQAASLVDGFADGDLAAHLEAALWLGFAEDFMDRLDDAIRHFERGIGVSRSSGRGRLVLPLMVGRLFALNHRGPLTEASELAEATIEGARLSGNDQYLVGALSQASWVATRAGDLQAALELGQESIELARGMGDHTLRAAATLAFASALLESGQAEQCRTTLLEALGGPELPLLSARGRCLSYEMLTAAELALGRAGAASAWVERAEAGASQLGLPLAASAAHRSRALLLLASDEMEAAAEVASTAAAEAVRAGASVEAARCRILAGRALAQAGERQRSLAELEEAAAMLATCGAEGYRQQAVRELRRLGRRLPSQTNGATTTGKLSNLSAREWEIAAMVSAGRTNREIADGLYLSIKTVERHLSHIFGKLGVRSRAAVAGLVGRQERGGPELESESPAASRGLRLEQSPSRRR